MLYSEQCKRLLLLRNMHLDENKSVKESKQSNTIGQFSTLKTYLLYIRAQLQEQTVNVAFVSLRYAYFETICKSAETLACEVASKMLDNFLSFFFMIFIPTCCDSMRITHLYEIELEAKFAFFELYYLYEFELIVFLISPPLFLLLFYFFFL